MKKYAILIIALLFAALCSNVFAQSSHYPFEVQQSGHGKKSIIFIPGLGCSGSVWDETKTAFEKQYTCHVLTMAGFAGVTKTDNASINEWKDAIADYIKQNITGKAIIIGHSIGGGMAMAIAADYPELIEKIVVVDALPCLAALMNPAFKTNENNDCSPITERIVKTPNDQFYQMQKRNISQMVANVSKQETVITWSMESDRETFAKIYCDFSNTDLRENLKNITCPSLILLQPSFKELQPAIEGQYKNLSNAQIKYAGKGLHFIMYDDTEWFANELNNFINTSE